MERNLVVSLEPTLTDPAKHNVIHWEDYEQELARLWSLSSALNEIKDRKYKLETQLETLIKVKSESLNRSNELEVMAQNHEARKLVMANMSNQSKVAEENSKNQEQQLSIKVRSLLVAGTALSVARKRLQELNRSLTEQGAYVRLKNLQEMLQLRQQCMVAQVSLLYPVKTPAGMSKEQELDAFPGSRRSGNSTVSRPANQGLLTILGLPLSMLPFTKVSFFTDKKEVQRSAAALGYVAHAVSLLASYLQVPLRYPLRLGGSHSYINDYAPSVEPAPSDSSSNTALSSNTKPVEFPLFLEGQDTTKAAYAVFLLNKDLEQLLNFIGLKSLGPRHVLANLKELLRTILSADYIDT